MRLHVLAGCRDILRPNPLPMELAPELIGGKVQIATAFWLSRRCGRFYHSFLFDENGNGEKDTRVEVFAHSLRENFGSRFEPLIVLPELLDAAPGQSAPGPRERHSLEVMQEIWACRPARRITVHALALPEDIDGQSSWADTAGLKAAQVRDQLGGLHAILEAGGIDGGDIDTEVIAIGPNRPGFNLLLRNAVAHQVAQRVAGTLARDGLAAGAALFHEAIARVLTAWNHSGIRPVHPLDDPELDRLSGRVMQALLLETRAE